MSFLFIFIYGDFIHAYRCFCRYGRLKASGGDLYFSRGITFTFDESLYADICSCSSFSGYKGVPNPYPLFYKSFSCGVPMSFNYKQCNYGYNIKLNKNIQA